MVGGALQRATHQLPGSPAGHTQTHTLYIAKPLLPGDASQNRNSSLLHVARRFHRFTPAAGHFDIVQRRFVFFLFVCWLKDTPLLASARIDRT